jgi:hypothetical protein
MSVQAAIQVAEGAAQMSDWIAVVALVVGFGSFLLAYRTYRDNARAVRLAHMHKLFSDYLGHELDIQLEPDSDNKSNATVSLNAFKMYTLEEMWLWLKNEKQLRPLTRRRQNDHKRLVNGWTNTIRYHIAKSEQRDVAGFVLHRRCYSSEFVHYVLDQPCTRVHLQGEPEQSGEVLFACLLESLGKDLGETQAAGGRGDPVSTAKFLVDYYRTKPMPTPTDDKGDEEILELAAQEPRRRRIWRRRARIRRGAEAEVQA